MVVNMDLPWNPAVLEQRIGRVHRLGQRRPVQVVNFVAQGTIEHGMLSVLKFKQSLFAGVLDGGEKEVFLGGSRLNKFMETVERASAAIPEATVEEDGERMHAVREEVPETVPAETEREPVEAVPAAAAVTDPWTGLLQNGLAILEQLTAGRSATAPGGGIEVAQKLSGLSLVGRDERTGETYIKLPMPNPAVLDKALQAFGALLQSFKR
jgi:hypothetical protein